MVREVTSQSWFSRMGNSVLGVFIGILLVLGSLILVFWNESNSLHMSQSLAQAEKILVTVSPSPIDLSNNMKVVYFTGQAVTNSMLTDPLLGVQVNALRIERKVEMYQWQQDVETTTEKETGGSVIETKTYDYKPVWSGTIIDSTGFKVPEGHQNPTRMPFNSAQVVAADVTVGDYHLPDFLVEKVTENKHFDFSKADFAMLQTKSNLPVQHDVEDIYLGNDINSPTIGDVKISVLVYLPQQVSVIAQQANNTLQAYKAPAGKTVALLVSGEVSPQQMIMDAQSDNSMMMWVWRAVSLLLIMIGIGLILKPLSVISDVLPFIGNVVEFGVGLLAVIAGLLLWTVAFALAWVFVRPVMAIGAVVVVSVICFLVIRRKKSLALK